MLACCCAVAFPRHASVSNHTRTVPRHKHASRHAPSLTRARTQKTVMILVVQPTVNSFRRGRQSCGSGWRACVLAAAITPGDGADGIYCWQPLAFMRLRSTDDGTGRRSRGTSEFQRWSALLSKDPTSRSQRNGDGAFDPSADPCQVRCMGVGDMDPNPHGKRKMGYQPMPSLRAKS